MAQQRKVVNPPDPKASANAKQAAGPVELPDEEPRRTKTIDGVKYVLVNGGWRRAADSEESEG